MRLALAGINHRTAPVQIREKLAFRTEDLPAALLNAQARGAKEALILSTCNRVEIAATIGDNVPAGKLVESFLSGRGDVSLELLQPHVYLFEEAAAIRHLFRVASSLDSMIIRGAADTRATEAGLRYCTGRRRYRHGSGSCSLTRLQRRKAYSVGDRDWPERCLGKLRRR